MVGCTRSDAELLAAHVAGDRYAFEELLARHHHRLLRLAQLTIRHREDAADALQDALLSAHRGAASFRHDAAVTSWLYRIVTNACLDQLRRRKSRENLCGGPGPAVVTDPAVQSDTAIVVHRALMRLPVDQRAAVVAVDMAGYSVADAAQTLGVPVGTIKSRCARARARLAATLDCFDQGG
jgi:RNA polymerase sigma-70 factor, ECF subfamily